MAKGYLIALVKMTNPANFMANYGSVVADVFAKFDGRFLVRTPDVTHHEGRQFDVTSLQSFQVLKRRRRHWEVMNINLLNLIELTIVIPNMVHLCWQRDWNKHNMWRGADRKI